MLHIFYGITGVGLFIASVEDIRKKQISLLHIIVLLLAACVWAVWGREITIMNRVAGAAIGIGMLGIAQLTEEKIGKADAFIITALGILLGFRSCLIIVTIACGLMSMLAIGILVSKKGTKQTKIPFVPALSVGYLICLLMI